MITTETPLMYHPVCLPQTEAVLYEPALCAHCRGYGKLLHKEGDGVRAEPCDSCSGRRMIRRGETLRFNVWGGTRKHGLYHAFSVAVSVEYPWRIDHRKLVATEFQEARAYGPRALEWAALKATAKLLRCGADMGDSVCLLYESLRITEPFEWPEEWSRARTWHDKYNERERALAAEDGVVL